MRANQFINEAVSISRHYPSIVDCIKRAIGIATRHTSKYDAFASTNARSTIQNLGLGRSVEKAQTIFRMFLEEHTVRLLGELLGNDLNLLFQAKSGASGSATGGTTITVSPHFLDMISRSFSYILRSNLENEARIGDKYAAFLQALSDQALATEAISSAEGTIEELASIIMHEMVHIHQQRGHRATGRAVHGYGSYLSNPKKSIKDRWGLKQDELLSANIAWARGAGSINGDRQTYLHAGSPEEIAAHAHEFAIDILRSAGYLDKGRKQSGAFSGNAKLADIIPEYVRGKIIPTTSREIKVFKRYAKLTALEIQRFLSSKNSLDVELP